MDDITTELAKLNVLQGADIQGQKDGIHNARLDIESTILQYLHETLYTIKELP